VIALVIPPSIGFILFGVVAQVSITRLFLAGIAPGIIMALAIMTVWWFAVRKEPTPVRDRASRRQVAAALREGIWALVLPVFILVGLRLGFFTPTEAGVFASVYAGVVALFIYGDMKVSQLYDVLFQAAYLTAMIMFLVAAAMAAGWMVTVSGVPQAVVQLVQPLIETPKLLVFTIILLVLVVGMVMDMVPITLILVPMVMPAVRAAGVDPVYFGVLFMLACAIGLLTPPVGTVLSVVSGVTGLDLWVVIRGIMPFIIVLLLILLLMIFIPQLITVPLRLLAG
jgi:tripartite ATP-independent transporter DctM subunit